MAVDALYSASWYQVAELRPRLSAAVRFHRHVVRGEDWMVIQNPVTGRVHRLTPAAWALVGLLDGERTAHQAWEATLERLGDDAPTQDEAIWVLGMLYGADVLRCDVPPDTAALLRRVDRERDQERRRRRNPIAFRVPLLDPDAFLSRTERWVRPLFSRAGAVAWGAIVLAGAVAALRNAPELAAGARSLLEPAGMLAIWFAYPLVKALHELGHAYAVKRWGGEVHEMGVLFLVFVPVPYVDASAASVFPEKRRRMLVGAAGIAVELCLAAVALGVWLASEPGLIRHAAYAVLAIGGVSTLLFNGNPLLRFDGYYVLADALEIPNLAPRSSQYVGALARRHLLGMRRVELPETAPGEAPWLVGYAVAAFVYRLGVMLAIALHLAGRFFALGIALAALTVATQVALPVLRQLGRLLFDPVVGERRARALAGGLGPVAAVVALLFLLPLPLRTRSEGVIWLPEHAHVRAGADGFVREVLADPHASVRAGQLLMRTRDPSVEARVRVLEAERRELALRVQALSGDDRVRADITRTRLADTEAALARARERAGEVWIRSPADGVFVLPAGADPVGQFVAQGQVVAWVVDLSTATARVALPQEDVALLRDRTEGAWVRLARDTATVLPARIARQVPTATDRLPTRALGTAGGGSIAVEPTDPEGLRTLAPVFEVELALPARAAIHGAGERVHVRFDHGTEPAGPRVWRAVRRVFLRQLGV